MARPGAEAGDGATRIAQHRGAIVDREAVSDGSHGDCGLEGWLPLRLI